MAKLSLPAGTGKDVGMDTIDVAALFATEHQPAKTMMPPRDGGAFFELDQIYFSSKPHTSVDYLALATALSENDVG